MRIWLSDKTLSQQAQGSGFGSAALQTTQDKMHKVKTKPTPLKIEEKYGPLFTRTSTQGRTDFVAKHP